jgi:1-acyl-sn-glycerol-3-phosphate acyltransferase
MATTFLCFARGAYVPLRSSRPFASSCGAARPRRTAVRATAGGRASVRHDDCGAGSGGGADDAAAAAAAVVAAAAASIAGATAISSSGGDATSTATHPASGGSAVADGGGKEQVRRFSTIGVAFFLITYAWGVLGFIFVLAAHPLVMLFDRGRRRLHQSIGLSWLRISLASVRIVPEVINSHNLPPQDETVVYVANHVSYMDIYVLPYLNRALKVVAKAEIFSMPIVGWAMRMAGNIGVKRSDRRGQLEAFREMVAVLERGVSLVVYPEGTRSKSGRLSRFKLGAFRAAKSANVSIVPVTITGTREMMPSHAYVPLCYPRKPIRLTVHPAIDSLSHTVEELRDLAFSAIDSTLDPSIQSTHHRHEAKTLPFHATISAAVASVPSSPSHTSSVPPPSSPLR